LTATKSFGDLHINPSLRDMEQVKKMILKSEELGFRLVGVTLPHNVSPQVVEKLRKICSEAEVDFATRIDLAPKTSLELLDNLRRFRRRFELVSVLCSSKPVARQAAKDRRVDLLSFPASETRRRFFDRAEAELASEASASLEVDMAPLLSLEGFQRIRLLSCLRREVAIARRFNVPVTISSGATTEHSLRNPNDFVALATLFDMSSELASEALSKVPFAILRRNREKLSPDFVAPGIRVVRRRDCCLSV